MLSRFSGFRVIARDPTRYTAPIDTLLNILASVVVPGNSIGIKGSLKITAVWSLTNGGNSKAPSIAIGANVLATNTAINSDGCVYTSYLTNKNAANAQTFESAILIAGGATGQGVGTSAIDTTQDFTINFRCQKSIAGDVVNLEYYSVEVDNAS